TDTQTHMQINIYTAHTLLPTHTDTQTRSHSSFLLACFLSIQCFYVALRPYQSVCPFLFVGFCLHLSFSVLLFLCRYLGNVILGEVLNQLPAAASLRAAQVEMWQQKQWQSPYYWASFVLQGEWK